MKFNNRNISLQKEYSNPQNLGTVISVMNAMWLYIWIFNLQRTLIASLTDWCLSRNGTLSEKSIEIKSTWTKRITQGLNYTQQKINKQNYRRKVIVQLQQTPYSIQRQTAWKLLNALCLQKPTKSFQFKHTKTTAKSFNWV